MVNSRIYKSAEQALAAANASLAYTPSSIHYGRHLVADERVTVSQDAEERSRQLIDEALASVLDES